jgi:N,N'-diacetyllegionaminate synthase
MESTYVISEIGNNHNGQLEKAIELIAASAKAGADAVKFQSFRGIDIVSPKIRADEYEGWDVKEFEYWHQFLDSIALSLSDHQAAIDEARKHGLDFITTPTSPEIVDQLEALQGIRAYKIASMDLNNIPLIEAVARTDKEVILSTGMGEMDEIRRAVAILSRPRLSILHCVSDYPLDPDEAFLNNIAILRNEFPQFRIGFSDHSLGHELCIAARCLGAVTFEKHITLSRDDPKRAEHHFSLEPPEFKELVSWLRCMDRNLSNPVFSRSPKESANKDKYRRSYHYKTACPKGQAIGMELLAFVRPGDGIQQDDLPVLLGKQLTRDVEAYDPCLLSDVELERCIVIAKR